MTAIVTTLALLVLRNQLLVLAITEQDFYDIGQDEVELERGDDILELFSVSNPPFTFYNVNYTTFIISTNGRISVREGENQDFVPRFLPTNGIFIAPFWSDVDTGADNFPLGTVRYGITRDPATLSRAQNQIRSVFSTEESFSPSYLIVANWEKVGYYVHEQFFRETLRNTFQCVLLTDGMSSFVIFQYPKNGLNWTAGDTHGENGFFDPNDGMRRPAAIAGFNFNDSTISVPVRSEQLPGSGTDDVRNLTDASNIGNPGVWIFQVDEAELINPDTTEATTTTTKAETTFTEATTGIETTSEAETTAEATTEIETTSEAETTAEATESAATIEPATEVVTTIATESETTTEIETTPEAETTTEVVTTTETETTPEAEMTTEVETTAETETTPEAETTTEVQTTAETETTSEAEMTTEVETTAKTETTTRAGTTAEVEITTEAETATTEVAPTGLETTAATTEAENINIPPFSSTDTMMINVASLPPVGTFDNTPASNTQNRLITGIIVGCVVLIGLVIVLIGVICGYCIVITKLLRRLESEKLATESQKQGQNDLPELTVSKP